MAEGLVGSASRGLILHKLMEELLNGEISENEASLAERAAFLAAELGGAELIEPAELARTTLQALAIPEVAALRPNMIPEVSVLASTLGAEGAEQITVGVIDALVLDADGRPETVIDWKSDVAPSSATLTHYQEQVRSYLKASGAKRGLIVLATSGQVIEVTAVSDTATTPLREATHS